MSEIVIRNATLNDIDFIVDTIIAAEKSGTDNFGPAHVFELTEEEMRQYLNSMLEEKIDGCELSISSFIVADYNGEAVAAFAGWIEGQNEDELPSALLKSNLFGFCLPKQNIQQSQNKADIVRPLQIEREEGAYQLEYSYTKPEFRGQQLMKRIIDAHIDKARESNVKKMQVHVFDNNYAAIRLYEKMGFSISIRFCSDHPLTKKYFPSNIELLMEKTL